MSRLPVCFTWLLVLTLTATSAKADLLGYWSADSTGGQGVDLPNDQGDGDLDGELVDAQFTADGGGHSGEAGDYAVSFEGEDSDYVVIPATEETFEEITITAWVNGIQNGAWAGLVVSRDGAQPIGLDFSDFSGQLTYIWNDNSSDSWGFISDVSVPEDEWTFVALTIDPEKAVVYAGAKGGDLDSAENELPHFPQDNFSEWRWAEDDGFAGARNFSGLMDDVSIWNEALSVEDIMALHAGSASPLTLRGGGIDADFDGSGSLDLADINLLASEIRAGTDDLSFDLNSDSRVDLEDLDSWITDQKRTWRGDSNLDGEFNSSDFVAVFTVGKYEKDEPATWAEGDWNADGRFNSSDFVSAFAFGGYEQGPLRASAVPEPTGIALLVSGMLGASALRRRRRV